MYKTGDLHIDAPVSVESGRDFLLEINFEHIVFQRVSIYILRVPSDGY